MSGKTVKIEELIRPGVEALGYELWGVDYQSHGRHTMLRVYIDSEKGIGVDDCAKVSHQISGVLDVEDPIAGEYNLEVSSPGMDRPLYTPEQYIQYVGNDINVRLRVAFEGRRKFLGRLMGIEDGDVVLMMEEHEYLLPFDQIDKANVVPRF
ncbi:MAG: ribosome maturation factor RimP [Zhongshania sp.]|uniref:Ribosome maturation factor RimP n=1 Tax=Zhongshania guokunii TaxID=641783 RepID=A0ABV3U949_9GAMM|nr:ribosome maturation factor RimP [Zhongshania sp.]MDF1693082.1 ribosome maturation factor RimP [Zhongshania sp.]